MVQRDRMHFQKGCSDTKLGRAIHQWWCCHFRRTLTICGNGQSGTPRSSTRVTVKSCSWRWIISCSSTGWDQPSGKQLCRKVLVVLVDNKLSTNQQYALVAKKANSLWGCTGQGVVRGLSEVIVPSTLVRYLWVLNPVLGSPLPERHDHTTLSTENSYEDDKGADTSFI